MPTMPPPSRFFKPSYGPTMRLLYGPMSHTSKAQKAFLKHDHIGDRKNKMDYYEKDETVQLYLTLTAVQTS